jgi:hypothetical protein
MRSMKIVLRAAALVAVVLAMVTVRVLWQSRAEWKAAETSQADQHLLHLGRAARAYTPGNPWARRAREALAEIGRSSKPEALAAAQELRSAILATRSFYTPDRALLDEMNRRIAILMAAAEADAHPAEEAQAWHAARLAQDDAPSVGWSIVALLGLAAWIGCAFAFFTRAIGEDDKLRKKPALYLALGIVAGLALFFLGLARA